MNTLNKQTRKLKQPVSMNTHEETNRSCLFIYTINGSTTMSTIFTTAFATFISGKKRTHYGPEVNQVIFACLNAILDGPQWRPTAVWISKAQRVCIIPNENVPAEGTASPIGTRLPSFSCLPNGSVRTSDEICPDIEKIDKAATKVWPNWISAHSRVRFPLASWHENARRLGKN